jgi:FAD:protein FMN transferase
MKKLTKKFPKIARLEFKCLGTHIDIQIVAKNAKEFPDAKQDLREAQKQYQEFEKIFSRFDSSSELSNFNTHLGVFLPASKELKEVALESLKFYSKTRGYFDPRIIGFLECAGYDKDFKSIYCFKVYEKEKSANFFSRNLFEDLAIEKNRICFKARMDYSGIVKGYVTDFMAKILSEKGWENFLVDSGGDMFFSGKDEENNVWTVNIEGVTNEKIIFRLLNKGIATSGISRRKWEKNGKRFHHLINPKNPEIFSFDLKSVTVIAPSTTKADVLAKMLFLMGKDLAKKYAQAKKIPCAILDYRGNVWISSSIKKYLC